MNENSKHKTILILSVLIATIVCLVATIVVVINITQGHGSDSDSDTQEDSLSIETVVEKYEKKINSAKSDEEKANLYLEEATEVNNTFNPYAPGADINEMVEKGLVEIGSDGSTIYTEDVCEKIRKTFFKALELNPEVDIEEIDVSSFYPCIVNTGNGGDN